MNDLKIATVQAAQQSAQPDSTNSDANTSNEFNNTLNGEVSNISSKSQPANTTEKSQPAPKADVQLAEQEIVEDIEQLLNEQFELISETEILTENIEETIKLPFTELTTNDPTTAELEEINVEISSEDSGQPLLNPQNLIDEIGSDESNVIKIDPTKIEGLQKTNQPIVEAKPFLQAQGIKAFVNLQQHGEQNLNQQSSDHQFQQSFQHQFSQQFNQHIGLQNNNVSQFENFINFHPQQTQVTQPNLQSTPQITNSSSLPVISFSTPMGDDSWSNGFVERINFMTNKNIQSAEIKIHPPELGSIIAKIKIEGGVAELSFTTQHGHVKEAIESNIPRLRETLSQDGLTLLDVNVSEQNSERQETTQFTSQSERVEDDGSLDRDNKAVEIKNSDRLIDYYA